MNTGQFKKGDKAYRIGNWDSRGVFFVETVTIQSWGKIQGTATHDSDNHFLARQIYLAHTGKHPGQDHYFKVSEVDPTAKALELAAAYIAWELQHNICKSTNPCYHQPSVQAAIEHFTHEQPSVKFLN